MWMNVGFWSINDRLSELSWKTLDRPSSAIGLAEYYMDLLAPLEDLIVVSDVGWQGDGGNRPLPHFRDAFSAKGSLMDWQDSLAGTKDALQFYMEELDSEAKHDDLAWDPDASLRVAYELRRSHGSSLTTFNTPGGS